MQRLFILISLCLTIAIHAVAQDISLSQNATISLLTCTPGSEIYSKYGHSAIRIQDTTQNIDWTFNYGVFNFNTDDFYLKFVRGETWYQLNVEDTDWFIQSSTHISRQTYEQVLNLTYEEKQILFKLLLENYQPQNRYYLYNFVFDNCATRPYTLLKTVLPDLEQIVEETKLPFEGSDAQPTFRQLIHHYSEQNSWVDFGIDFIFGRDADILPTPEQRLFLPEQLMNLIGRATLADGTPLCLADNTHPFVIKEEQFIYSPYFILILLSIFMLLITILDIYKNRISWYLDVIILFFGSIFGLIGFYLSFFSIHPLVKHNFNLLFINPFLFIVILFLFFRKSREWIRRHLYIIGICWTIYMLIRVPLIVVQSWHWLMLIPIFHGMRMLSLGIAKQNRSNYTKRIRMIAFLLLLIVTPFVNAEPRLTVVVSVDGLNIQALNELRGYWQQGGLRTLDEEAHFSSICFPQLVYGGNETLATIVCGNTPSEHSISTDYYFDRHTRKLRNIFNDNKQKGINTDLTLSPQAIRSLTLTDEFRLQHTDRSKIYAIGINAESTILLAGHAANACAWIEDNTMRWATTGYYSEGLPSAADKMNIDGRIAQLASENWIPRMDIPMYMHPTAKERQKGFNYVQKDVIKKSPAANTLVIELALAIQQKENLGIDQYADMLLLNLNVISPSCSSDLLQSAEQEDLYIRLNQDLGWFMEQLNKRIGKDQYRLVIFGIPRHGIGSQSLEKTNLKVHCFNTERIAALCNTYLMAIYGHERWIDGGYANNIYLNRTLIEQKKIRLEDIQRKVSRFLLEAEGTKSAFTYSDLWLLHSTEGEEAKLRRTLNKHTAGDVVFLLEDMWITAENENKLTDCIADVNPLAPFMLWTTEIITMPERECSATEVKSIILK